MSMRRAPVAIRICEPEKLMVMLLEIVGSVTRVVAQMARGPARDAEPLIKDISRPVSRVLEGTASLARGRYVTAIPLG